MMEGKLLDGFLDFDDLIRRKLVEMLDDSAGPMDIHGLDASVIAQSNVDTAIA